MADESVEVLFGAAIGDLQAGMGAASASVSTATGEMKAALAGVGTASKELTGSIESMTAGIEAALAPLVALMALFETFHAIKDAVTSTVELGVSLDKLSQKTGVSVETLSRLQNAAIQSEISAEDLDRGFKKLAISIQEAHAGTGKAADAFRAMGISVNDAHGKTKPMDELLLEIAGKFSGYADGAQKAALASDLFGARFGQVLIPFLNKGKEGIAELMQQSDALGATMGTKDVAASKRFEEASKELTLAIAGLKRVLGGELIPALTAAVHWFEQLALAAQHPAAAMHAMLGDYQGMVAALGKDAGKDQAFPGFVGPPAPAKPDAPGLTDNKAAAQKKLQEELTTISARLDNKLTEDLEKNSTHVEKVYEENTKKRIAGEATAAEQTEHYSDVVKKIQTAGAQSIAKDTTLSLEQIQKQWMDTFAMINRTVTSSVQQMITGHLTLAGAVRNVTRQMLMDFVGMEARQLEVHIATEMAKEHVTVSALLKRVALESWAALRTVTVWAATAIATVAMDAVRGAAAAFASIAAIPIIGPFLAPVLAGATLAAILAMGHNIKSAAGGYDIPSGINPVTQLHAEEMVLPKELANQVRTLASSGARGGPGRGGDTHVHIHAMDAASFREFAGRHQDTFHDAVQSAARGRRGR